VARNRYNKIAGQFAAREIEMLESWPYRALSLSAHRALARIEIELAHHGGKDNGRLPVTYDDFQDYGIDRHSIRPALCELEALGFIEVTDRGRAGNAEFRRPAKYRLTYKGADREPPTHEWKRIETKEQAEHLAKRARSSRSRPPKRGEKQDARPMDSAPACDLRLAH
jgi:DNA-binding transcriptional MocR family regulator